MKKYLGKILTGVGILLALIAIFMMFAPAATYELAGSTKSYSGMNLAFGYTNKTDIANHTVETKVFDASANILTYILVLVGIVCAVVALLGKGGKILPVVAAVCFAVAGVLFFCTVAMCAPHCELEGDAKKDYIKKIKESFDLGAGAIVAGVFSLLSAAVVTVPVFLKK